MSRSNALILVGAVIGFFLGSSIGVATGGTAYNGAYFLVPLGAFIGWLISRNKTDNSAPTNVTENSKDFLDGQGGLLQSPTAKENRTPPNFVHSMLLAAGIFLATLWNFHIDLLEKVGVLESFIKQPFYFVAMCIGISIFLPPFVGAYLVAWLAAQQFGMSEETKYRAVIP